MELTTAALGIVLAANTASAAPPLFAVPTSGALALAETVSGVGRLFVARVVLLLVVCLAAGFGLASSDGGARDVAEEPPAGAERPKEEVAPRKDANGDPLPPGAVARLGSMRFNHGDGLGSLHYALDGRALLSWGGGFLRRWDAATGREIGHFATTPPVWCEATHLAADGKTLLYLDQDFGGDMLRVWDLDAKKAVREVRLSVRRRVWSVDRRNAFSPDGSLALVHTDGPIHVFEVATARELCRLPPVGENVLAAAFAGPDRVVTVDKDQSAVLWEARTGRPVRKFRHGAPAAIATASLDGRFLATLEHHTHAIDRPCGRSWRAATRHGRTWRRGGWQRWETPQWRWWKNTYGPCRGRTWR